MASPRSNRIAPEMTAKESTEAAKSGTCSSPIHSSRPSDQISLNRCHRAAWHLQRVYDYMEATNAQRELNTEATTAVTAANGSAAGAAQESVDVPVNKGTTSRRQIATVLLAMGLQGSTTSEIRWVMETLAAIHGGQMQPTDSGSSTKAKTGFWVFVP